MFKPDSDGRVSVPASTSPTVVTGMKFCVAVASVLLAGFFCLAGSTLVLAKVAESEQHRDLESDESLKPVGDYRKDLKVFLKRSKVAEEKSSRLGAIVDLCALHRELVADPRFSINRQLQGFRATAATRLKNCQKSIELEMLREERAAKAVATDKGTGHSVPGPERNGNQERSSTLSSEEQYLLHDVNALTAAVGGPIRLWNHTGGNFAGPACDYGPDLVRLIETTISPEHWRSAGGNGVIHYYRPLRVLVVTGGSAVHDDLTDLLRTLRSSGR